MNTLLRRRAMIAAGGGSPTPPTPPSPSTPVFELSAPTTTQEYNTGVKLFDSQKSFTILCEATFNNYNWGDWTQGLFGIKYGTKGMRFKFGSLDNAKDYQSGSLHATANRYSALIMNNDTSNRRCSSVLSRADETRTVKIFVRYDTTTRKVECGFNGTPTTHYFTVDGHISSENELMLLFGGATGTVSVFKVYLSALSDNEINAFFA